MRTLFQTVGFLGLAFFSLELSARANEMVCNVHIVDGSPSKGTELRISKQAATGNPGPTCVKHVFQKPSVVSNSVRSLELCSWTLGEHGWFMLLLSKKLADGTPLEQPFSVQIPYGTKMVQPIQINDLSSLIAPSPVGINCTTTDS